MDFVEKITQFSKRVEIIKDNLLTEEATKTSIILPFFQILGYEQKKEKKSIMQL